MTTNAKPNNGTGQLALKDLFQFLSSLKITVICLALLAIIVIWGTVYQANNGLYEAQQKFFHSWIIFIFGVIPFPGAVTVMFVLFINLVFSIIFRIGFRLSKFGNLIGHLGLVILLAGSGYTMYFAEESVLQLREGETSKTSSSRYMWELSAWELAQGRKTGYRAEASQFFPGQPLTFEKFPFKLTVLKYFPHCTAFTGASADPTQIPINGSGITDLQEARPEDDAGDNTAGVILKVEGAQLPPLLLFGQDNQPARFTLKGRLFYFELARKRISLPLSISLLDFSLKYYPNSTIPKSFESRVAIKGEGDIEREVVISMNRPLRFKDYTFFQSSYFVDEMGKEYTVLAVVRNSGRLLPYIASITIFMGLLVQFLMKLFRRKPAAASVALFLLILSLCAGTERLHGDKESFSADSLKQTVILENGRKKPLDSFAQNVLKQISGRADIDNKSAIEWLAQVMFDPKEAEKDKIFLVTNPEVLDAMGAPVTGKARDRYGFSQLKPGLRRLRDAAMRVAQLKPDQRSFIDNEIYSLYQKLYLFQQIQATFDFIRPHDDFRIKEEATRDYFKMPAHQQSLSFYDLTSNRSKIQQAADSVKDTDEAQWTPFQREIMMLQKRAAEWGKMYHDLPVAIIPSMERTDSGQEKWLSPWDLVFLKLQGSDGRISDYFNFIRGFIDAYARRDQKGFDSAVNQFNAVVLEKSEGAVHSGVISAEILYNRLDPFYRCTFFYGFALLFLLASFIGVRTWFYRASFLLLGIGFLLHAFGIIIRMYIMSRPPVTNLYETFVFTGFITALLGLILEWSKKRHIGIATGSLAGFIMLMIAGKYALDGDTMGMLAAVLDSNFWLAFHVMTIILGYAGILLSGFLGHVYIVQRIAAPHKTALLDNTFQALFATQAFGILFTFLGTVLGGIWADQSWGRFWGWDPKENGALLILLWSAILFHARLTGWIRETGMAAGAIIGVITVALAWFGVNLLGVGLHSYGFTSGVANILFAFIIFETLFIATAAIILSFRKTPS